MQVPPFHVDYIPSPWANDPNSSELTNFTYLGGQVTYTKNNESSAESDMDFETQLFGEAGINVGVKAGVTIKRLRETSIGGEGSAGWKKIASQTQSEANKNKASTSMSISSSTATGDNLMSYSADFHIWRYPVIGQVPSGFLVDPTGGTISGEDDGTQYFTYTMSDTPDPPKVGVGPSSQFDDYNPSHEEGNLFSYPSTIEGIPGYSNSQTDLAIGSDIAYGSGSTFGLDFSNEAMGSKGSKTTAKNEFNGSLSFNLAPPVVRLSGSANAMFGFEVGNSSTFTKSNKTSEKIMASLPAPSSTVFDAKNVGHTLKMRAYSDAAGVMNMAFAVDMSTTPTSNPWLWTPYGDTVSVYQKFPDPSLLLPGKYDMAEDKIFGFKVDPHKQRITATQIRGIWFYDVVAQQYTSSSFTQGVEYKISFPIYNASFIPPPNNMVTVEVGYMDKKGDNAKAIGRCDVELRGWYTGTENNKATVEFHWTVPADMPVGSYDFYFQIDPDNQIEKEIHKNWNVTDGDPDYDPAGNNRGRYPFSVHIPAPPASELVGSVRAASAQDGSFTLTIDGMSFEDFRKSLSGRTENFRAFGTVTFHGDEPLKNVHVEVVDRSGPDMHLLVANRYIPALFPEEASEFSFIVWPSKLKSMNLVVTLYADNAIFSTEIEPKPKPEPTPSPSGGGGGGCDAGVGVAAAVWALWGMRRSKL